MELSIIIGTWNESAWTNRCLRALKKNTVMNPYEIIWIDNGSSDDQHNAVLPTIAGFNHKKERHPKPLGFPKAMNRGIRLSTGRYIVLLNNDVEVLPKWDTELKLALARGRGAAGPVAFQAAGWQGIMHHPWLGIPPHLMRAEHRPVVYKMLREKFAGTAMEVPARALAPWRNMLAFFCTMFNREVINKVGLLDEGFGMGFGDDDDYCLRMRKAGYKIWLCPGAVVLHAVSVTMKKVPGGIEKQMRIAGRRMARKHRR